MITAAIIKEKFEFYRKWFQTLLVKEFLNLPYKEQTRFLSILQKFHDDCLKVHKEAKNIKEKSIKVKIIEIIPSTDFYLIKGVTENNQKIEIKYSKKWPEISKNDPSICIIFSEDEETWYSSKEELITGRIV